MTASLRVKRGTRSQLDTAAAADGLAAGEPLLVTDEGRPAIGLGADAYAACVVSDSVQRIVTLSQAAYDALDPPDPNTLYLVTES